MSNGHGTRTRIVQYGLQRRSPPRKFHFNASLVASLTLGALAGVPTQAWAQTPSPLLEWQYSVGVPLEKLWQPKVPDWLVQLGAAATFQPRFEGSDRYHLMAGPSLDIRYKDLFFLSTGEGLGVNVVQGENWRVSVAAAYDLGRRAQDDPEELAGMGNINPAPELKVAADYAVSKTFPLVIRADIRRSFGGSNGWIGDVGAYMPLPGSTKQFFWFAGPSVTLADSKYMNSWFGVNQQQAEQSQYPYYHASAGFKSVGFGVSAVWFFQKHWFATADGALEQLVGSAANSPVTHRSTTGVADISINYQF